MQAQPRAGSEPEIDFNDMFSLRKPRDAKAGLASGAKSVAKGVLAGAVGLVAAPAIGAHQEGLKGFAKGAAAGIAGAVLLPVTGVAVGATQVVRGIANSAEAVREKANGKWWDEVSDGMQTVLSHIYFLLNKLCFSSYVGRKSMGQRAKSSCRHTQCCATATVADSFLQSKCC